jgi:hypothetical protein
MGEKEKGKTKDDNFAPELKMKEVNGENIIYIFVE